MQNVKIIAIAVMCLISGIPLKGAQKTTKAPITKTDYLHYWSPFGVFGNGSINGEMKGVTDMEKTDDQFIWLEEIEGERALSWVKEKNAETLELFQADPRYAEFEKAALQIYEASDKIPYGSLRGGYVYNFWQDEEHVRGIWRRTPGSRPQDGG